MTVFEDQYREMQRSGLKLDGIFNEQLTDSYGWAVEENYKALAASNNAAEALIGCISVIRASIGLMAAMGFTPEQMQEQWELIDQMAPANMPGAVSIVEALMLNQGVVNIGRPT